MLDLWKEDEMIVAFGSQTSEMPPIKMNRSLAKPHETTF
jgi:hypothetical protein